MTPGLDSDVQSFFAGLLGRQPALDDLAILIVQNDLVKGALLLGVLWWLWAEPGDDRERRRELVLGALMAALAAALLSRVIVILLPFRPRPVNLADLGIAVDPRLVGWERGHGSFPSDHAALAFALATGIFVASPILGTVSLAYVSLLVCLPRVYLGLHWLTDILGGAAIGAMTGWWMTRAAFRSRMVQPVLRLFDRHPGIACAGLFLTAFGLMTRFEDARALVSWIWFAARGGTFPRLEH